MSQFGLALELVAALKELKLGEPLINSVSDFRVPASSCLE